MADLLQSLVAAPSQNAGTQRISHYRSPSADSLHSTISHRQACSHTQDHQEPSLSRSRPNSVTMSGTLGLDIDQITSVMKRRHEHDIHADSLSNASSREPSAGSMANMAAAGSYQPSMDGRENYQMLGIEQSNANANTSPIIAAPNNSAPAYYAAFGENLMRGHDTNQLPTPLSYVSALNELCQKHRWPAPTYQAEASGSGHQQRFNGSVTIDNIMYVPSFMTQPTKKALKDHLAKLAIEQCLGSQQQMHVPAAASALPAMPGMSGMPSMPALSTMPPMPAMQASTERSIRPADSPPNENWIGKLQMYQNAVIRNTIPVAYQVESPGPGLFTATCTLENLPGEQFGDPYIRETSKKRAQSLAAHLAVKSLVARGMMSIDGTPTSTAPVNPKPQGSSSDAGINGTVFSQLVHRLCAVLHIPPPTYHISRTSVSDPHSSLTAYATFPIIPGMASLQGKVGYEEGLVGKQAAKERVASKICQLLQTLIEQRDEMIQLRCSKYAPR